MYKTHNIQGVMQTEWQGIVTKNPTIRFLRSKTDYDYEYD